MTSQLSGGNRWTDFVRDFARKHSISYMCALSTPECSKQYKSGKQGEPKTKKEKKAREMMEAEDRPAPSRKESLGDIFESVTISGSTPPSVREKLKNKGSLNKALADKQREQSQMSAEDRDAPASKKAKAKKKAGRPRKYASAEESRIANIKKTAEMRKAKTQAKIGKGRTATVSASFSRPYNADVGDPNPLSGGMMSGGMKNPFDFGYELGHDVIGPALFGRGMRGGDFLSAVKGIGHALGKPYEAIPIERLIGLGMRGGMDIDMPSYFGDDDNTPAGPAYPPPAPPNSPVPPAELVFTPEQIEYLMRLRMTPLRIPKARLPPKKRGGMVNPFAVSHAIIPPVEKTRPPMKILPYNPKPQMDYSHFVNEMKKGGVRIGPVPKNTFVGMNQ